MQEAENLHVTILWQNMCLFILVLNLLERFNQINLANPNRDARP
jgi:hypothetical protein